MATNQQIRDAVINNQSKSSAEIAAMLSEPVKTPRPGSITLKTAAAILGATKAATLRLKLIAASSDPIASFIFDLLKGDGFDPSNPQVPAITQSMVASGIISEVDATNLIYQSVVQDTVTEEQIDNEKVLMSREQEGSAEITSIKSETEAAISAIRSTEAQRIIAWEKWIQSGEDKPE